MKLDGLVPLYKEMKSKGIDRVRFDYSHSPVEFDVLFFIDESPYPLMFGAKKLNFAFQVVVEKGFEINPRLSGEDFKGLCEALKLVYNPDNPFSMKAFFQEFSRKIPSALPQKYQVAPKHVARFRSNVEEADKTIFCGWLEHSGTSKKVTESNLQKTKEYLGQKFFEHCKKRNVSTRWTADESKAQPISLP